MKVRWASVCGIDPGESTGLVWVCVRLKEVRKEGWLSALRSAVESRRWHVETVVGLDDDDRAMQVICWLELFDKMTREKTNVAEIGLTRIVCESFTVLEGTKDPNLLAPVRIASKLSFAIRSGFCELAYQKFDGSGEPLMEYRSPSDKEVTKKRLKHWKLDELVRNEHEKDALSHALLILREL